MRYHVKHLLYIWTYQHAGTLFFPSLKFSHFLKSLFKLKLSETNRRFIFIEIIFIDYFNRELSQVCSHENSLPANNYLPDYLKKTNYLLREGVMVL